MAKVDRERVEAARLLVIQKLEEYGFADETIWNAMGISPSTFQRLIAGRYLMKRPRKRVNFGDEIVTKQLVIRIW